MTEEISGVIERVTFHNDDSGFCVLRVKTKGHREETTVIGSLPSVSAGERVVAGAQWLRVAGQDSRSSLSSCEPLISNAPLLRLGLWVALLAK